MDRDISEATQLVDVGHKLWPIQDGGNHVAGEDEVELVQVGPLLLHVIVLEVNVDRHKVWLDDADVVAPDLEVGILIADVNGPWCEMQCQSRPVDTKKTW